MHLFANMNDEGFEPDQWECLFQFKKALVHSPKFHSVIGQVMPTHPLNQVYIDVFLSYDSENNCVFLGIMF